MADPSAPESENITVEGVQTDPAEFAEILRNAPVVNLDDGPPEPSEIRGAAAGTVPPCEVEIPEGVEYSITVEYGNTGACTPGVGPAKITVRLGQ